MDRIRKTVLVRGSTCAEPTMDGIKYQLFNKGRRVKQTTEKAAGEATGRQTRVALCGCRHDLETMVNSRGINQRSNGIRGVQQ